MSEPRYRADGHHIYDGGTLIGLLDTPELAAAVADALNARLWVLSRPGRNLDLPQTCQDADGNEVEPADCAVNGPHYVKHPDVELPKLVLPGWADDRDQVIADRRSAEARNMQIHEPGCRGAVGDTCTCEGPR